MAKEPIELTLTDEEAGEFEAWAYAKQSAAHWKDQEMMLRQKVASFLNPNQEEGTKTLILSFLQLNPETDERNIPTRAEVKVKQDYERQVPKGFAPDDEIADKFTKTISYRLKLPIYRELEGEVREKIDEVITTKPKAVSISL